MELRKFIQTTIHKYLNEQKTDITKDSSEIKNTITVYHGTKRKFVDSIIKNGLIDNTGYNQGWYMVSTDIESALYHAYTNSKDEKVYIFEFEIPNDENDIWDGYPYLWKGYKRSDKSTWFALKNKIPKEFIKNIHKIEYEDWLKQKQIGY